MRDIQKHLEPIKGRAVRGRTRKQKERKEEEEEKEERKRRERMVREGRVREGGSEGVGHLSNLTTSMQEWRSDLHGCVGVLKQIA